MNKEELKARRAAWYRKNSEKVKARVKKYADANKDKIKAANKKRRLQNPEKHKARHRAYYLKNKEKHLKKCSEYHKKNRDRLTLKMRESYRKNAATRKAKQRAYYANNKEGVKAYQKEYALKHPENVKARSVRYRKENLEQLRAYDRERAKNMSPARKAGKDLWRLKNRARVRAYGEARHLKALKFLGGKCGVCKRTDDLSYFEIDHFISFLKRGIKRPRSFNISEVYKSPKEFQPLCPHCHAIKSAIEKRSRREVLTKGQIEYRKKRDDIIKMFGGICAACKYKENPLAFHVEHVVPINGVGRTSAAHEVSRGTKNLQLLCALCHRKKTRKEITEKYNALLLLAQKAVEMDAISCHTKASEISANSEPQPGRTAPPPGGDLLLPPES